MIPLKDDIPTRRTPVVTIALIAINAAVFAWQLGAASFAQSVWTLGLTPAALLGGGQLWDIQTSIPPALTVFTSMFAHGSVLHIAGNMLFLWIFGNNVEDAMGRGRFVLFYLFCGLVAAGAQVGSAPHAQVPMVGASGAIAGVLGAYLLLYPHARVLTLVPIFIFLRLIWVPAIFFLGLWFLFQILGGLGPGGDGGVAFWAHVGGFAAGAALVKPFAGSIWRTGRPRAWRRSTW